MFKELRLGLTNFLRLIWIPEVTVLVLSYMHTIYIYYQVKQLIEDALSERTRKSKGWKGKMEGWGEMDKYDDIPATGLLSIHEAYQFLSRKFVNSELIGDYGLLILSARGRL